MAPSSVLVLCCGLPFLCLLLTILPTMNAASSPIDMEHPQHHYKNRDDHDLGPTNWTELRPRTIGCSNLCDCGMSQSPINIIEAQAVPQIGNPLVTSYHPTTGQADLDNGFQVTLIGDGGFAWWSFGTLPHRVINVHWHTPSEHVINGVRSPLEGHIVHMGPQGQILVIGILYDIGEPDRLISSILQWTRPTGIIALDNVRSGYYNYGGSLTTPPCTELVNWVVLQQKYTVSRQQLDTVSLINGGNNARPLQPLNGRMISKFEQNFQSLNEM